MRLRSFAPILAVVVAAVSAPAFAQPAAIPGAAVRVSGRTAVVSLPLRLSQHWVWVSATRMMDTAPFTFSALDYRPGAGPGGADLAVFTYVADKPGSTTLKFGLVPAGKMLVGLPSMTYKGPVAARFEAKVSAK